MADFDPDFAGALQQIARHEREGLYRDGPSVAFAYARDLHEEYCLLWSKKVFGLQITRCEEMTDEIAFWLAMEKSLREAAAPSEQDLAKGLKDQFRYVIKFLVPMSDTRQPVLQSFLYVSAGIGLGFYDMYDDLTEAKYAIDGIGLRILGCGLSHKRKLVWAGSDYNFNGINPTREGLPMDALLKMLEKYAPKGDGVTDAA